MNTINTTDDKVRDHCIFTRRGYHFSQDLSSAMLKVKSIRTQNSHKLAVPFPKGNLILKNSPPCKTTPKLTGVCTFNNSPVTTANKKFQAHQSQKQTTQSTHKKFYGWSL
jgi:hypothetical protein